MITLVRLIVVFENILGGGSRLLCRCARKALSVSLLCAVKVIYSPNVGSLPIALIGFGSIRQLVRIFTDCRVPNLVLL